MTRNWPTKLRRSLLSVPLLLFLVNCQQIESTSEGVAAPPPPPEVLPLETIKSICLAWFNSLGTWEDSDTEATKNGVDFGYRMNEEVCGPYLKLP